MNTTQPSPLDEMLVAIGRWQAQPVPDTWTKQLAAIRAYLTFAEKLDPLTPNPTPPELRGRPPGAHGLR